MWPEGNVTLSDMVALQIQPATQQWPQPILEFRTGALKCFKESEPADTLYWY